MWWEFQQPAHGGHVRSVIILTELVFVAQVGSAFQKRVSWKELIDIASHPPQEYIFKVENFDALRDIQNQLKEKIFAIEGKLGMKPSVRSAFPSRNWTPCHGQQPWVAGY